MKQIDQNIFDQILLYKEGELTENEKLAIEQKLKNDSNWQQHEKYFQTITEAIATESKKAQLKEWHSKPISLEEEKYFESIIEKDRKRTLWRQLILFFTLTTILVVGAFLLGRESVELPETNIQKEPTPIAQEEGEIEEELMGSIGEGEILSIPFKKYSKEGESLILLEDSVQEIFTQINDKQSREYTFEDGVFILYIYDNEQVVESDLEKIEIVDEDKTKHFLKFKESTYQLFPTNTKRVLGATDALLF